MSLEMHHLGIFFYHCYPIAGHGVVLDLSLSTDYHTQHGFPDHGTSCNFHIHGSLCVGYR